MTRTRWGSVRANHKIVTAKPIVDGDVSLVSAEEAKPQLVEPAAAPKAKTTPKPAPVKAKKSTVLPTNPLR